MNSYCMIIFPYIRMWITIKQKVRIAKSSRFSTNVHRMHTKLRSYWDHTIRKSYLICECHDFAKKNGFDFLKFFIKKYFLFFLFFIIFMVISWWKSTPSSFSGIKTPNRIFSRLPFLQGFRWKEQRKINMQYN